MGYETLKFDQPGAVAQIYVEVKRGIVERVYGHRVEGLEVFVVDLDEDLDGDSYYDQRSDYLYYGA